MSPKCPRGTLSTETSAGAGARWVTRVVPCILLLLIAYATYVFVQRICIEDLIRERNESNLAAMFLALYFIFLPIALVTYFRVLWIIKSEPGYVTLHPSSRGARVLQRRARRRHSAGNAFARRYDDAGEEADVGYALPDHSPDSPGLESFYSRDVFVCEGDGRPKWCHDCGQWKPDRASHSREIDRCVRKMDHFCPWVGGMVAENSFKFFAQFTFYAALFCAVCLSAAAYSLAYHVRHGAVLDGHLFALIFLAGLLGLFSGAMSGTAARFICGNMTNVDLLKKSMSYQLAVRVPLGTPPSERFMTITYPLPRRLPDGSVAPESEQPEGRDRLAKRTFAILRTEAGENPWDLGWKRNWTEVMGHNPLDWFLPIRRSPCARHDCAESEYPYGKLVSELKVRHGLDPKPWTDREQGGMEMSETGR